MEGNIRSYMMTGDVKDLRNIDGVKYHCIEQGDSTISSAFTAAVNSGQWLSPDDFFQIAGGPNSLARSKSLEWLKNEVCTWLNTVEMSENNFQFYLPGRYAKTIGLMEFNPNKCGLTLPVYSDFTTMDNNGAKIAAARRWLENLTSARSHREEKIILFQLNIARSGAGKNLILSTFVCTYADVLDFFEPAIDILENQATWMIFMGDIGFARRVTGILNICRGIQKGTVDLNEANIEHALRLMRDTDKIVAGDISAHRRAGDVMFRLGPGGTKPKSKVVVVDQYMNLYNFSSTRDADRAKVSLFLGDVIMSRKDGSGTKSAYTIFRKKGNNLVEVTIIDPNKIDDFGDNFELLEINDMVSYFVNKVIGKEFENNAN